MNQYIILDCYVDEPACFGVPPFISPYPRYIYGALINSGVADQDISYITIDSLRASNYIIEQRKCDVFLIGGAVVPGKYLGARIGSLTEVIRIINSNPDFKFIVGGLISRVAPHNISNAIILNNDIEKYADKISSGSPIDAKRNYREISSWAVYGADVVKKFPGYPDCIAEIETGRGCPRQHHCTFCAEGNSHPLEFREASDILKEINALLSLGVTRFRIGRQADILQYKTYFNEFIDGFPKPEPGPIIELFSELKKLRELGKIELLNIDNANPGTIANFPIESEMILNALADAVTPGDTMAIGIESFDAFVIKLNNLKTDAEKSLFAIKTINDVCGNRIQGIPRLLPGVNLLHGLPGESENTFKTNFEYLRKAYESGMIIKRINIRKVLHFPGTPVSKTNFSVNNTTVNRFTYYRDRIRHEIDHQMLKKIYPIGTILKNLIVIDIQSDYSYCKQIASYAITVKIPMRLKPGIKIDAAIIGYKERSVIALPLPIKISELSQKALELIPGIGRRMAGNIILNKPHIDIENNVHFSNIDKNLKKLFRI
jgi:radical SAM superfamily enzyme with C-terminal helix-hairpin-helix motif